MVRIPSHLPPSHPGELVLEEFLKPMGITQSELARSIGVTFARVNELINGKRGITPDTALRLERFLGASAQYWLNAQQAWDLHNAMQSPESEKIRRIKQYAGATD